MKAFTDLLGGVSIARARPEYNISPEMEQRFVSILAPIFYFMQGRAHDFRIEFHPNGGSIVNGQRGALVLAFNSGFVQMDQAGEFMHAPPMKYSSRTPSKFIIRSATPDGFLRKFMEVWVWG